MIPAFSNAPATPPVTAMEAEAVLRELANVFFDAPAGAMRPGSDTTPSAEMRYRALLDQIPAVVFMAYLDEGIGEAYVSPQIEKLLGFSQREGLQSPGRLVPPITPPDK